MSLISHQQRGHTETGLFKKKPHPKDGEAGQILAQLWAGKYFETSFDFKAFIQSDARSGGGVVDNALDYLSMDRKIDSPLLRSFGRDFKPRSRLDMTSLLVGRNQSSFTHSLKVMLCTTKISFSCVPTGHATLNQCQLIKLDQHYDLESTLMKS